jgi:dihydrofolate synthase / folylpolyglutamate synthase
LLSIPLTSPTQQFTTLDEWLAWQETLHPSKIDLGLERIHMVLQRLGLEHPAYAVVTIGGTNGKGSSVALLEAILSAAGYSVGATISPHLLRYNERVRINRREVEDRQLCEAFARIDVARGEISLTYFEFATLAALEIFQHAGIDIAILEVGMGGRLDAVNVVDPDVALVTTIGIDHVKWLGPDREAIAREKAGIFRAGRPAVCGEPEPPATLLEHAWRLGAQLYRVGHDFTYETHARTWSWQGPQQRYDDLPYPVLQGDFQARNAAAVIMVLELLRPRFEVNRAQLANGLQHAAIAGRFQIIAGKVTTIVDVAHNPHGAQALAQALAHFPCQGRTHAIMGMLADKDIKGVLTAMMAQVDSWHLATLTVERGATAQRLLEDFRAVAPDTPVRQYPDVITAWREVQQLAQADDRIVVFGSFHTVAAVLQHHSSSEN